MGKRIKKCVVFRSVVVVATLSTSVLEDGIANRNKILFNEAQVIWAINKATCIGYEEDKDEVISNIVEMEAQRYSKNNYLL